MDDRRLPWLVSAIVLALLPAGFLVVTWWQVLLAIAIELALLFFFAFLAGRNNA